MCITIFSLAASIASIQIESHVPTNRAKAIRMIGVSQICKSIMCIDFAKSLGHTLSARCQFEALGCHWGIGCAHLVTNKQIV